MGIAVGVLMGGGIYRAMNGASVRLESLDTLAHNLANADTAGFRAERVAFAEVLGAKRTPVSPEPGAMRAARRGPTVQAGFTATAGRASDTRAGTVVATGRTLDAALLDQGYFAVETPAGLAFTRDGEFRLDAAGALTTRDGLVVRGAEGALRAPEGADAALAEDGSLLAGGERLGRVAVARFAAAKLQRGADGLFRPAPGVAPEWVDAPRLAPASLERSNVDPVLAVTELVSAHRGFEAVMKALDAYRRMDERAAETGRLR
jgi:flagellar basal-body rod protein FlgG